MLRKLLSLFRPKNSNNKLIKTSLDFKEAFAVFAKKDQLVKEDYQKLEATLIKSDIGVDFTNKFIDEIKQMKLKGSEVNQVVRSHISSYLLKSQGVIKFKISPLVILFSGVNGSGKTTSIGKLAHFYKQQDKKVLLAACDTFRAAAAKQLEIWANRSSVDILMPNKEGEDPASIAYKAFEKAKTENYDIVLIDTAGRLQNYKNLMDQLGKISRVLKKIDQSAPHLSLLTIDGTTGQNAIKQYQGFNDTLPIDGLIVTKLDGTAKGGILVALADIFKTKIYFIGKGEAIEDLEKFNAEKFALDIFPVDKN